MSAKGGVVNYYLLGVVSVQLCIMVFLVRIYKIHLNPIYTAKTDLRNRYIFYEIFIFRHIF